MIFFDSSIDLPLQATTQFAREMPVRKFEDYLRSRSLVQSASLSTLAGQRVAVDGGLWLKSIAPHEAFHVAIGGRPLALMPAVLEHAELYRLVLIARLAPVWSSSARFLKVSFVFAARDC